MPSERRRQRFSDILDNVARVRSYTAGMDKKAFLASPLVQDAVERCFERIAEAARKIGEEYDDRYPDAGLKALRQFGSVLRHDYDAVHPDLVWGYVERRMDALQAMAESIMVELPPDRG